MKQQTLVYPNIDMKQTGLQLKKLIEEAGYNVKYIQHFLHLSCPQPIYRWFKGQMLPSVDHLYGLSKLLGIHMEELLVPKCRHIKMQIDYVDNQEVYKRVLFYWNEYRNVA